MSGHANFNAVRTVLIELRSILCNNNGQNFIARIDAMLGIIDEAKTDEHNRAFDSLQSACKSMMQAKEGFSDYNIWRDDFQARLEANAELDLLRTRLWDLLVAKQ